MIIGLKNNDFLLIYHFKIFFLFIKIECGTNLQKFNVSLEPLWSNKFQLQIKNTLILTSLFNSYINDNPNLNESKKHKITDFETNFQRLFDEKQHIDKNVLFTREEERSDFVRENLD